MNTKPYQYKYRKQYHVEYLKPSEATIQQRHSKNYFREAQDDYFIKIKSKTGIMLINYRWLQDYMSPVARRKIIKFAMSNGGWTLTQKGE